MGETHHEYDYPWLIAELRKSGCEHAASVISRLTEENERLRKALTEIINREGEPVRMMYAMMKDIARTALSTSHVEGE